jgi:hypothetical protein
MSASASATTRSGYDPDAAETGVTKADLEHLETTLLKRFRQELERFEQHIDKSMIGFARRVVEEFLRSRSLVSELGDEPLLAMRTGTVDDMLAPFVLDEDGKTRLLAHDPNMVDAARFSELIDCTVQALHGKRKRGEVIGLQQAKRKIWFPIYQIDENGRLLTGLSEVIAAFGGDCWRVHRFLSLPQAAFDGATGVDALKAGRREEVLTVIHGMREAGYM